MMTKNSNPKLLAVASSGGHWIQLQRLRPAFENCEVEYMSTADFRSSDLDGKLHIVKDANLSEIRKTVVMFAQVLYVMLKVRPDIIVSTGAAPGFAAIMYGRLMFKRTVWIDSIANSEQLSKSGKAAKFCATAWLTQWQNLETDHGPKYWGNVL